MHRPRWLAITDELLGPVGEYASAALRRIEHQDVDLASIPVEALGHLAECLHTSMKVNEEGKHAVAMLLIRQCVETLTLVDLGLQDPVYSEPLLSKWRDDGKSSGALRAHLEKDIWPHYGDGLWREPWAAHFGNLARAVQPYAHYTRQLQGWQQSLVAYSGGKTWIVATGIASYDPLKASRITLLHALVIWTLGRVLLANNAATPLDFPRKIAELGQALGKSTLLFKESEWEWQLLPHMLFQPGHDWHDP